MKELFIFMFSKRRRPILSKWKEKMMGLKALLQAYTLITKRITKSLKHGGKELKSPKI